MANMQRSRIPRKSTRHARIADALHSAAIRLLRRLRKVDDMSGITAPRLSALSVVVFSGPLTLGELAAAEQVRPPTMTRLVSALAADGLVVREADGADGRLTIIGATRKGAAALARARGRRIEALAQRLASLSDQELRQIERGAELMRRVAVEDSVQSP